MKLYNNRTIEIIINNRIILIIFKFKILNLIINTEIKKTIHHKLKFTIKKIYIKNTQFLIKIYNKIILNNQKNYIFQRK